MALAIRLPSGQGEPEGDAGVLPIMSLLLGPPGAGKSMLARRLTTILPAMALPEAIDTTRIHSMAGRTGDRTAFVITRPDHPRGDHQKGGRELASNLTRPWRTPGQYPTAMTQGAGDWDVPLTRRPGGSKGYACHVWRDLE
jgi:Magnesium chelatase, subunit ChlI